MSDQLTAPSGPLEPLEPHGHASFGSMVVQFLLGVAVLAAVGALAGVVWEWIWDPAVGVVVDHQVFAQDDASLRSQFSGTGWYVVVGTVAGVVGGALVALFLDRTPLVTLASVVGGSVLGAWLMAIVGSALSPTDPDTLARTAKTGAKLPAHLSVSGHSPWIALPAGALVALVLVFVGWSHRRD